MPPPRLFIHGAVDTAEALCHAAKHLGWTTIVADARRAFATSRRMPSADELLVEWPLEATARVAPDHQTAIVVLTHDAKFDQPALEAALATEAFYIGALGSRRNQEKRRARLLEAGVPEEALARIAGPVRARHRRREPGGDRALDPRRDPRRPRRPLRRLPARRQAPDPRAGRRARPLARSLTHVMDPGIQKVLDGMNALARGAARARGAGRAGARRPRAGDRSCSAGPARRSARSRTSRSPAPAGRSGCGSTCRSSRPAACSPTSTAAAGSSARSSPSTPPAARSPTRPARSWGASATGSRPSTRSRPRSRTASPRRKALAERYPDEPLAVARRQRGRQPRDRRRAAAARPGARAGR